MTRQAFLDTGAFVAFLDRSDHQHGETVALFGDPPGRFVTSSLVVAESYGWFLHKLGEPAARTFRELVSDLPDLEILDGDGAHRQAVWDKLDALRGRKLTFVDASGLVWLEELEISTVWGTDLDWALEGATVLPGPPL